MPGFTLKIQIGPETHRRWIDTDDGEPLGLGRIVSELDAMRDAGFVADGYIVKYLDDTGDECLLEPESWRDFMASAVDERGRLKLAMKLEQHRAPKVGAAAIEQPAAPPPTAPAAPHPWPPQSAGSASAAYDPWDPQLVGDGVIAGAYSGLKVWRCGSCACGVSGRWTETKCCLPADRVIALGRTMAHA